MPYCPRAHRARGRAHMVASNASGRGTVAPEDQDLYRPTTKDVEPFGWRAFSQTANHSQLDSSRMIPSLKARSASAFLAGRPVAPAFNTVEPWPWQVPELNVH